MTGRNVQWTICAVLVAVFSVLTVTERWLELALALTVSALFWYGIVPWFDSDDNSSAPRAQVKDR